MIYTDTGLTPETNYCYRIRAWNYYGSSYSADICDITPSLTSSPDPPTGLTVTGSTYANITLAWQANATATIELGFRVERRQGGGSWAQVANLGPHSAPGPMGYTDGGLSPNMWYCYQVVAYNLYGMAASNQACGWTRPAPADLTFSGGLALTPAAPRRNQAFTLSWYVCNWGQSAASNFTDTAQRDNVETVNRTVSTLAPGTCSREWVYYPSGLPAGSHYWYECLDRYNSVPEGNESNNTAILSINIR